MVAILGKTQNVQSGSFLSSSYQYTPVTPELKCLKLFALGTMPNTEKSCIFLSDSSSLNLFIYLNKYLLFANYMQGSIDPAMNKTEPPFGPHGVYIQLESPHPRSAVCPGLLV